MKNHKDTTGNPGDLRRLAEERMNERRGFFAFDEKNTELERQRLVHELQVHQIELELQNEALLQSRTEVEEGLASYTDLYELAPIGYLTLGRDGIIRKINLTGARLLGQDRSHLVGRRLGLLVAAEHRPTFNAFLAKVFVNETKETCEVAVSPEETAPLTLELTGTAADGKEECRVVAMDITPRKRTEQANEALRSQLAQTHKMDAIGTFAGGIAHDFNNILGALLGGLSLLDFDLGVDNAYHADIQEMEALVTRGADLTKQLLGFARRGKYDVRPLNLASLVEKTSVLFGRTRKDIAIENNVAPGLRAVLMDHTQIEQVLLNLLANAGQAMPEGGRLLLHAEDVVLADESVTPHGAAPGHFVKLVITDTGIGMDAVTQRRIFEPFFSAKGTGQETGLGLASVYGIIKSHGGFITVESALGRGTTFTLFLPTTDQPAEREKERESTIKPGTETILVVDDEEQIVKVYDGLLSRIGYHVLTASGGPEAVELMRRHRENISLVILDMIMPDMSGHETYDALQKVAPGIKVLLSSGYSIEGQAQEILALGCNGFIQKPCDIANLSTKLREILDAPAPADH